jgi:hypothetical protein
MASVATVQLLLFACRDHSYAETNTRELNPRLKEMANAGAPRACNHFFCSSAEGTLSRTAVFTTDFGFSGTGKSGVRWVDGREAIAKVALGSRLRFLLIVSCTQILHCYPLSTHNSAVSIVARKINNLVSRRS